MWYRIASFILTVYVSHGCVTTTPEQRVFVGEDVCLRCNYTQCPGHLDTSSLNVEWEFQQHISDQPKIIIYQFGNQTGIPSGHVILRNVNYGSFDIVLSSVTHENNGTYTCRLRRDGIFYKNYSQLFVNSALNIDIAYSTPHVDNVATLRPWWTALISVALAFVLLICTIFFTRTSCRSLDPRKHILKQNIAEVETRSQTDDITDKVKDNSLPVVDMATQPSTLNEDNIYVNMVANNSLPGKDWSVNVNTPNAENIYVIMLGSPFPTNTPVEPKRSGCLQSD